MENCSELVSRRVRTKIVTEVEVDRYFDGDQCLGDNLTKAAVTMYGMSRNQIARLMAVDKKTVGDWYRGVIPREPTRKKLLKVVKAWRKAKVDLENTFASSRKTLPSPRPTPPAKGTDKKVDNLIDQQQGVMDTKVNPVSDGAHATQSPLDPAS